MQQTEVVGECGGLERRRVEMVVETLATLRSQGDNLAELAHDARNMVTALGLYCDLLQEPGVLATPYLHYGEELRLVAAASRRLVEKLVALDTRHTSATGPVPPGLRGGSALLERAVVQQESRLTSHWDRMPAVPIANFAEELIANRNLLAALAGPSIALTVDTEGGALPVRLTGEDLTRVLVNLVKNAAEAMTGGGRIHIALRERPGEAVPREAVVLTVEDSGPGIGADLLCRIFETGFTTQTAAHAGKAFGDGWASTHRGLGLSITRSLVEAAGGQITAANRKPQGASLRIELPISRR